jgi:hypothetical protein
MNLAAVVIGLQPRDCYRIPPTPCMPLRDSIHSGRHGANR